MTSSIGRHRRARTRAHAASLLVRFALTSLGGVLPAGLSAQAPPDTGSARADSARRIETVIVTAIRAAERAPIAHTTLRRAEITRRNFGQDAPLLLQAASPAITVHNETGTQWGYSYLRLRGLDQTRINITLDGVPLNDMEDQVLYFANFADLMSSVQSAQVQRGVGTSTNGTASFGGSVNLETVPIATTRPQGDVQLQAGSFGARRASLAYGTGLRGRFAAHARASALQTNGYRHHSGVMGRTGFLGAGWFGERDVVKLTALAGLLADTLAYVGSTRAQLAEDRRHNPLAPDERDRFGQQMVALAHTRMLSDAASLGTTVYRNSASGSYDYFELPDRYRFELAHVWYGATSMLDLTRGRARLNLGVNANTYARAHRGFSGASPEAMYDNTGHKQDASTFAKLSLVQGRARWFADIQGRWARFRYEPSAEAGISARAIDWAFLNPKVGVTLQVASGVSAFASYGATSREPARSDLFAGEDDLNASNVDALGDFSRVRPESVRDTEVGATLTRAAGLLQLVAYTMDFRNDIARIGAPTASGSVLRRNVGASHRRGVELDATWRGIPRLLVAANAAWSTNRIHAFVDSSRGAPVLRRNVEPLLTPRFLTTHRLELAATPRLTLGAEGRYQSRAFLDNTGSPDRVLPDFYMADASARYAVDRYALVVRGVNVGDSQRFASGSVSSSGRVRYFVLPARALFATVEMTF